MFPKIRNMATRIKTDGATTLGAIIGFMFGMYLAYKNLHLATLPHIGISEISEAASLMGLGTIFGIVIGALFDTRYSSTVNQNANDCQQGDGDVGDS